MRGNLMLTLTALIWGIAFVAQSVGLNYVGPFTFNSVRSFLGGMVLIPCIFLINRHTQDKLDTEVDLQKTPGGKKKLVVGGVLCGIALAIASSLQQIGIGYTTVGKAGFITALYIIIVPLLGLFLKRRVSLTVWISVALALAGMYFLCIKEGFSVGYGDIMVLLCAFVFSLHILLIDYFSPYVDGVKMSCIQFFTCGIICMVPMFLYESPSLGAILSAWQPILYAGVMSCGVAYTLQILGQKNTNPVVASLILSMESVFSVLAGWVILGQVLSMRELAGCGLVFLGIILSQLPTKANKTL